MARPRKLAPRYLKHSKSGKGRLIWTDAVGVRYEKLLPGPFGSPESLAAKARLELELATSPTGAPAAPDRITIAEVILAFHNFAVRHYLDPEGQPTKELLVIRYALRPLRELYGTSPATEFGPLKLKAVRQRMIDTKLSRALINRRISVIKRMFKWSASEELIPASIFDGLRTVAGLERGRTAAREANPVEPIDDATVDATIPFLPHHVRALIELMRHTGLRPSEACAITLNQIERTPERWTYKPERHKTQHRGKERVVPLGPKAQTLLVAFLGAQVLEPHEPIFSPRRARAERFERMRQGRKSKVQPSQRTRKKTKPKRQPAERYSPATVSHAVKLAAKKAGVTHWHPYRLRHTFATKVRKEYGLEAAQVLLGHSRADTTQIYAERNESLAASVAAKIG